MKKDPKVVRDSNCSLKLVTFQFANVREFETIKYAFDKNQGLQKIQTLKSSPMKGLQKVQTPKRGTKRDNKGSHKGTFVPVCVRIFKRFTFTV